jgi:hypothetical protein
MSQTNSVKWLRPEYKGRENELVHLAAGAALVDVSRSTVSNWAKRHAGFPKIALMTGISGQLTKYVPRSEFIDFARTQLSKKRGSNRPATPRRPAATIRTQEIEHAERQIARLTELEARQATTLANTRRALKKHRQRLQRAQQRLAEEVAAVRQLEASEPASCEAVPSRASTG